MRDYIKDLYTAIFTAPTGCGKIYLFLVLKEKECNEYFDYIIII